MENQQVLADKWREIRARLQEKWDQLTDEDLRSFDGNVDHLIGRIQRKTGESRAAIERFLEDFMASISDDAADVAATIRDKVQVGAAQAAAAAQQGYDAVREGYAEAERAVQQRPGQAMAVAFGLGLLAGVGAVLLLRDRPRESAARRAAGSAEGIGRQVLETLASLVPKR